MTVGSTEMPSREDGLRLLYQMRCIRRFEETCIEHYSRGKIRGFLHVCIGEEAVAAGVMPTLSSEDDVVSTYREHGHALARGVPMKAVLAEMYGKQEGCCRGRGGSMHLFSKEHRFYGGHAIVGAGLPVAVGLALARKLRNEGGFVACLFGDGAVAEGEFHESLNLAALWRLPVVFFCENNLYAMGTGIERHQSETDLCKKAESYRVPAEAVDGMDVFAVESAAARAGEFARAGNGPFFLELKTYRFRAHSMFDPELYRTKKEVEEWKRRGPIVTLIEKLKAAGHLRSGDLEAIDERIAAEIAEAVAFSEEGSWEPVGDLLRDVYAADPTGDGVDSWRNCS